MNAHMFLLAYCIYATVLGVAIWLTRPTARRAAAALTAGAAVALVGVGVEAFAHAHGWWRYPGVGTPYGPPLIYPAVVLIYTTLALLGWRVVRRFGWRGELAFLAVATIVGPVRDYRVAAQLPELFVMGPGVGPLLADAVAWAGTVALAHAAMRLLAGPAAADPLARPPRAAA